MLKSIKQSVYGELEMIKVNSIIIRTSWVYSYYGKNNASFRKRERRTRCNI